jgi:hypothetical protein
MEFFSLSPLVILFLSGFAGLGCEMVRTRIFSTVPGHEIVSTLAVMPAFFCGLGLGSRALDRPLGRYRQARRWNAALEITIGIWSAALSLILPWATLQFASSAIRINSVLSDRLLVTHIGVCTKIVFTGDPEQIDHPYLDASSNGLSYLVEKLKGEEIAGHVTMVKGERSQVAELGAKLL